MRRFFELDFETGITLQFNWLHASQRVKTGGFFHCGDIKACFTEEKA